MAVTRMLAQMTVKDLDAGERFYGQLFGGPPDARPMDGLLEWHLADSFGVQVWLDADRAGRSAMVLNESDLDARAAALADTGITYEGPMDVTASRIVQLADPDGNLIVFTGA